MVYFVCEWCKSTFYRGFYGWDEGVLWAAELVSTPVQYPQMPNEVNSCFARERETVRSSNNMPPLPSLRITS